MSVTRPFGAVLRRYQSGLELIWTMTDSWVGLWAERLDPAPPPPPPDNVVHLWERQLQRGQA